ncbi:MAG TPA: hypothetical protein VF143_01130 [Candidatus Nanopelagicales bacterium]
MNDSPWASLTAAVVVVLVPMLVVWMIVVVDVLRQPRMSPARKALWILACSLVWPVQILYLLLRPQQGRIEREPVRTDAHAQLVTTVLEREAGLLDGADYRARLAALRPSPPPEPIR